MQAAAGFCLIEILVSLVLTTIIILSLLFAQLHTTQAIHAIRFKTSALTLTLNTNESMLVGAHISTATFNLQAQNLLPGGQGAIIDAHNQVQYTLTWLHGQLQFMV